jgi:hypothetical protein
MIGMGARSITIVGSNGFVKSQFLEAEKNQKRVERRYTGIAV